MIFCFDIDFTRFLEDGQSENFFQNDILNTNFNIVGFAYQKTNYTDSK